MWRIASVIYVVGAVASVFVMLALATAGFLEIGRGVIQQYSSMSGHAQAPDAAATPLGMVLEGLELIFLAPLAYLAFLALWRYVDGHRRGDVDTSTRRQVIEIKSLVIGLIIAVVATDLLREALSPSGSTYESAIAGSAIIAVLAAYIIGLETVHARSK